MCGCIKNVSSPNAEKVFSPPVLSNCLWHHRSCTFYNAFWAAPEEGEKGRQLVFDNEGFSASSAVPSFLSCREHAAHRSDKPELTSANALCSRVLEILEGIIRFHIVTDAAIWGSGRLISLSLRSLIFIRDMEGLSPEQSGFYGKPQGSQHCCLVQC